MTRLIEFFRNYKELAATLVVGVLAFIFYMADISWVNYFVSAFALVIAASLSVGMVKDIMAGHWGIDLLAVTAIIATVAVGEYWAALIVCLMLSGGEALEDYAAKRARSQLTGLLESAPTTAHRLDGDDVPTDIDIDEVAINDRLLVKAGEVIPVDSILLSDHATTEESSLTGEPLPVEHSKGDELMSGGVNGSNAIIVQARSLAADSQYQAIIKMVKQAQESRAPVVRVADKVAVPFTIISFIIAGAAWWISGDVMRLAQVLVVATPCPLLLAAPIAFLAGMNRAAKENIIVKDSGTLEKLSRITSVALDKTGTITYGQPRLVDVHTDGDAHELLQVAASIESHSNHPLAKAIVAAAKEQNATIVKVDDVVEHQGDGISGYVNGVEVRVGSDSWLGHHAPDLDIQPGQSLIHVAYGQTWKGALVMEDSVRDNAADTVSALRTLGVKHIAMLTGDAYSTANLIGSRVGVDQIDAELLPAKKVQALRDLPAPTMMVGDGINDAPVIATADVGVAMGAKGAAAASESADVVIMTDDIYRAPRAIAIGKRTMTVALQAIGIGVGLSVVLMLIGATGVMPAVVGAFMQEVVDLACILWALLAARPDSKIPEATLTAAPVKQQTPVEATL